PVRPAPQTAPQAGAQPDHDPGGERGRFGINSLIGRMTGGQGGAQHPRAAEPSLRRGGEDPAEADRQREIPAFLRRQAN
ncbi:MAG: cell division protein FtsZ, partial [Paracoccaceae bacterium]